MGNIKIDEEGYLVMLVQATGVNESGYKEVKYKVNKEGLFEEVIESDIKYEGIEVLGLTPRTLNALIIADILSLDKLEHTSEYELRKIKGIGNRAMKDINDCISYYRMPR